MSDDQHRPRQSRIPDFRTREEEAEFWDTHDLSDYWDELMPTNVLVSPTLTSEHLVTVRLTKEDWEGLDRVAREQGIFPNEVIRDWVKDRLHRNVLIRSTPE